MRRKLGPEGVTLTISGKGLASIKQIEPSEIDSLIDRPSMYSYGLDQVDIDGNQLGVRYKALDQGLPSRFSMNAKLA